MLAMSKTRLYPGITKDMYRKPVIIQTEDLAEGVYAASGSSESQNVSWVRGTHTIWNATSGQVDFTLSIPSQYVGNHVKLTIVFDQTLSGAWGENGLNGQNSVNGKTLTLDISTAPQSGTVFAQYNAASDVTITSIKIEQV